MSRKAIREELANLMTATGDFNIVYDYPPTEIKQATKAIAIYTTGTDVDIISADMENDLHYFNLDVYVRREDSDDGEDDLDTLFQTVRTVLKSAATTSNVNWSALMPDNVSTAFFAIVSGKPYRVEQFKVIVKETI